MASVAFEHVTKRFDGQVAVDDLTLDIRDREFLVLVGPSGSGKTTALRLLAGLDQPSSGSIRIDSRRVDGTPPKDRDIALVFQSYALYPHLSVFENIAFGLRIRRSSLSETKRRVTAAAESLGLLGLLERKPHQLSGGQRQRVALGRAVVREPKVFLFDEPLSNLDAPLRIQMRTEIQRLHQRLQTTFIYVTHDQTEAMTMATRIAVMDRGQLQQLETPQSLYDRPNNLFVAGFMGSPAMNFLAGRLLGEGDGVAFEGAGIRLRLPAGLASRCRHATGRGVTFGLRPEHIHDPKFAPAGILGERVILVLEISELLGNETMLYLLLDGVSLVARVDPRSALQAGARVELLFDVQRAHFFDSETGSAL